MDGSTVMVVLAASRKHGARCYAGRELRREGVGGWVRPLSSDDGNLDLTRFTTQEGTLPRPLDVVAFQLGACCSHGYQTENWLLAPGCTVQQIGRFPTARLPLLCDHPLSLWDSGYSSSKGLNDRLPLEITHDVLRSLYLVELEDLRIRYRVEYEEKPRARGHFYYHGQEYALVVTDTAVEHELAGLGFGEHAWRQGQRVFACISMGMPFEGHVYKYLAALYAVPKDA